MSMMAVGIITDSYNKPAGGSATIIRPAIVGTPSVFPNPNTAATATTIDIPDSCWCS